MSSLPWLRALALCALVTASSGCGPPDELEEYGYEPPGTWVEEGGEDLGEDVDEPLPPSADDRPGVMIVERLEDEPDEPEPEPEPSPGRSFQRRLCERDWARE